VTDAQRGGAEAATAPPWLTINAVGRSCPVPVILLAERIGEVPAGQLIEVLADDPVAKTDLPAWCALQSCELVRIEDRPAGWSFLVRRAP
jgi:tRNA 2-thiouridine synthesizing protein A